MGAPTWIRGERQLLDTTGKNPVVSCPFSLHSSILLKHFKFIVLGLLV